MLVNIPFSDELYEVELLLHSVHYSTAASSKNFEKDK